MSSVASSIKGKHFRWEHHQHVVCLVLKVSSLKGSIINMSSVASSIKGKHFRWEHHQHAPVADPVIKVSTLSGCIINMSFVQY